MMIGTDYPENHLPDDDGVSFLAAVTPILSAADITFGNLEGVLVDGGEPGKKCSNPDACYLFRSPSRYVASRTASVIASGPVTPSVSFFLSATCGGCLSWYPRRALPSRG